MMSCYKCCFWPCDRTAICQKGTYWIRDRYGNLTKIVEPSFTVAPIIMKAVTAALGENK